MKSAATGTSPEPTLAAWSNPLLRYIAATRPAFLSVTLVGCLLGVACAHASGITIDWATALTGSLAALFAHAGVNVLNDYFDAQNGTDDCNTERVFPFTGGSRFIQNGVLTRRATRIYGYVLLAAVLPAGLWLTARSGSGLILIGLAGMLVGWAYSAPPLQLVSRGMGEIAIACGWLLVVAGTDYVQRKAFATAPVAAGLGYALLVADVLYINQFPDVRADGAVGKRTLVVRLGTQRARWGYALLFVGCGIWLLSGVALAWLPRWSLLALAPLALSASAAHILWQHASQPRQLAPAIKLTILAALCHGAVLSAVLMSSQDRVP